MTMRQWFYGQHDQQHGPIPEAELVQLLRSALLPADTLVWTEGMQAWAPAHTIPGFLTPAVEPSVPAPAPASAPMPRPSAAGFSQPAVGSLATSGVQVRPWVRYWARMLDFCLLAFLAVFVLPEEAIGGSGGSDLVLGLIMVLVNVCVEPALLATWGTTPGKALLRVRLRRRDGSKLSYLEALFRSLNVWLRGLGLGLPIIGLITLIYSYNRLTQHGVTSWDEEGGFDVDHQIIGPGRIIGIGLALILVIVLAVIGEGL